MRAGDRSYQVNAARQGCDPRQENTMTTDFIANINNPRALTGFAAALLLVGLGGAALLGAPTTVAAPTTEQVDTTITSTTDPAVTPTGSTPTGEAPSSTPTSLTRVPMTAQLTETSPVLATAVPVSPTLTVSVAPPHPTGILAQVPLRIFTPAETSPTSTTSGITSFLRPSPFTGFNSGSSTNTVT
jgi:hypothetical protein